jgi:hypothetical protein
MDSISMLLTKCGNTIIDIYLAAMWPGALAAAPKNIKWSKTKDLASLLLLSQPSREHAHVWQLVLRYGGDMEKWN